MNKVRKLDFILSDNEYETVVFRFRPRQSSCHSFGDKPPKSWNEVYKVYYSYSIIKKYKDDRKHRTLFDCGCDECSVIDEVAARCLYLASGQPSVEVKYSNTDETITIQLLNNEIRPIGYGVNWDIKFQYDVYWITLFDWDGTGYRFHVNKEQLKAFGDYLNRCCEYMLAHGDPI
jgi:hypothetical protein